MLLKSIPQWAAARKSIHSEAGCCARGKGVPCRTDVRSLQAVRQATAWRVPCHAVVPFARAPCRLCGKLPPGEGRVLACLQQHRVNISSVACKRQMLRLMGLAVEDYRLDYATSQARLRGLRALPPAPLCRKPRCRVAAVPGRRALPPRAGRERRTLV